MLGVALATVQPEAAAALSLHHRDDGPGLIEGTAAGVALAVMGLPLDQDRAVADLGRRDGDGTDGRGSIGKPEIGQGVQLARDAGADLVRADREGVGGDVSALPYEVSEKVILTISMRLRKYSLQGPPKAPQNRGSPPVQEEWAEDAEPGEIGRCAGARALFSRHDEVPLWLPSASK